MTRKSLERATARYAERFPAMKRHAAEFVDALTAVIDDAGINYLSVTGRAKSPESFADKVRRRTAEFGHTDFDPAVEVTDQVGARIITYVHSDIPPVAQLLADNFTVLEDRDMGRETAREGRFGYASRHMLISDDPQATGFDARHCASVQIRTVLQHAWAEFEHDARYKGTVPEEHAAELDRRFTLAAGLIELADREFSIIRDTLQSGLRHADFDSDGARDASHIDPRELASFLAGWYESAGFSRSEHYLAQVRLLTELDITSIPQLRDELQQVDTERILRAMGYRHPPGAIRRLDDDLLALFRERYADLPGNAERRDALRRRMQRLGSPD
ncbi:GTP pyrophosphokinase [Brevibacterium sp. 5221]|uniref:GTP pyrophosphokinase n=1 Tax=Brevibacterium rongguiense TaxID=2695267 RepID=A0A6N9H3J2_9MICO|nr:MULTISPECIES: GTP pyrophosphokinase [Brevibacterium]MYM18515.1 GTP pyrophosphokinase [Brevibacterium rongguiense]WAL39589.1 GTP pyrophosphokinase [Brevibacterium sp. BRM-1]